MSENLLTMASDKCTCPVNQTDLAPFKIHLILLIVGNYCRF